MNKHHAVIAVRAAEAQKEIHLMALRAIDAIKVKIGHWIRSDAQQARRRRERINGL